MITELMTKVLRKKLREIVGSRVGVFIQSPTDELPAITIPKVSLFIDSIIQDPDDGRQGEKGVEYTIEILGFVRDKFRDPGGVTELQDSNRNDANYLFMTRVFDQIYDALHRKPEALQLAGYVDADADYPGYDGTNAYLNADMKLTPAQITTLTNRYAVSNSEILSRRTERQELR